jgi:sugar-specific transcriptional regulator TrmB
MKTDDSMVNQLMDLNFTRSEATAYVALVKLGQTSAGGIIHTTHLHRSVVYESLDKLINKKLVFKLTRHGIAYFQATDPEKIILDTKNQQDIAAIIVPKLRHLVGTKMPEITVYEGPEEYARFWIDSVKKAPIGSVDYVAGSIGEEWEKIIGSSKINQYFKIAEARKISWKMVVFDKTDAYKTFLKKRPNFKWECRYVNSAMTKEGNFNVFGNSVILHSAAEPMIIEIKNESLVKVFKNLFDILWESGAKV